MAIEVGSAFVSVVPSTRGFGRELQNQIGGDAGKAGRAGGGAYGGAFAAAGVGAASVLGRVMPAAVGATAIAAGLGSAITKAGEFDQTIRTVGANAGIAGPELKRLTDLALEMGAKTSFSAQGAADAMLELSKGGLTAAQIEAGALRDTLTLAAAGGLELASAAGFMVQGLTTFGLSADQGGQVAAALAGAANASTASVESIGQALSQVGPSAKLAGLTIQETTAALAAFDNAGIKGSDAGTSLKTMLSRLVPQTESAATAMADLGLDFTNADGSFLSLRDIAGQLQTKLSGLSAEQKSTALNTIFGADAFRAAAVLAENGATGIDKLVAATSNSAAASDMAKVATSGYTGALDAFKGAIETAQIQLGTKLLPAATAVLNFLSGTAIPVLSEVGGAFLRVVGPPVVAAFNAVKTAVGALFAFFKTGDTASLATLFGVEQGAPILAFFTALRNAFTTISGVVQRLFSGVATAFGNGGLGAVFVTLGANIRLALPIIGAALRQLGTAFLAWIGPLIPPLLVKLGQLVLAIGRYFVTMLPVIWEALARWGAALLDWIGPKIPPLLMELGRLAGVVFTWLATVGLPALLEKLAQWGDALWAWISPRIPLVLAEIGRLMSSLWTWVTTTGLPMLGQAMGLLAGTLISWIAPKIPGLLLELGKFLLSITSWILTDGVPGLVKGALGLAGGLISGLVDGIGNGAGRVIEKIKTAITDKLPQFVKDALGIQSPSRVFYELGSQVSAGMAQGIISGQRDITRSVDGLVPNRVAAPRLVGSAAGRAAAGGGGIANSTSWLAGANITVRADDPAALQRAIEARARLSALVGGSV